MIFVIISILPVSSRYVAKQCQNSQQVFGMTHFSKKIKRVNLG